VTGGVSPDCGDREIPGIYTRVDNPEILDFIKGISNPEQSAIGFSKFNVHFLTLNRRSTSANKKLNLA